MKVVLGSVLLAVLVGQAYAANNTVTDWQYLSQQLARDEKLPHQIAVRVSALLALATHGSLVVDKSQGFQSNQKALVAFTGHYILSELYPGQQFKFDTALQKQLNGTRDLANVDASRAYRIAKAVGSKLLRDRANDGSQLFVNFKPSPVGEGPIGKYQYTPNQTYPLYPQLGKTKPFTNQFSSSFTSPYKAFTIPSAAYTAQLARVQSLGRKDSAARTQDQTDIAAFWAGVGGTKTVGGYWGQIAIDLLKPSDAASLRASARQLALFYTALYDNNIAVWYIKYTRLFWRPITAITQGDGVTPNDPTWTPFLTTPPHPEYPSGHQASSGAALGILKRYVGGDDISVTVVSDDPAPGAALPARSYTSLQALADEIGLSRVYGGLHFDKSSTDALELGEKTAAYAAANFGKKWDKPSSFQ